MRKYIITSIIICLLGCAGMSAAEELLVRHIRPVNEGDKRNEYFIAMLKLALEKTEATDGPFRLTKAEFKIPQDRAIASMKEQKWLDVIWTMTSREREQQLRPIRIPLLKGLLGHRIFIINQGEQARFTAVQTLDDLTQLRAGQGHDWPDTDILKANELPVITSSSYEGLFGMLQRGRFDYFPRGVNEPWDEVRSHSDLGLVVEDSLLLQYPAPIYFFVNHENTRLADRLERGLRLSILDGSFDKLFYSHPTTREIFEKARLETRRIFKLNNPLLPEETPLDQGELWYSPHVLSQRIE